MTMDKLNCFSLTTEGHIAHLVLNRPEAMNTMSPTFWRELHEVLTDIHRAGTARALVISSTGKFLRSTDGGVNWRPTFDAHPVQSIGALAVARGEQRNIEGWATRYRARRAAQVAHVLVGDEKAAAELARFAQPRQRQSHYARSQSPSR